MGAGRIPAYGRNLAAPPPQAPGTPCPDGPNGPETYDLTHPHYIVTARVPVAIEPPANPALDPESQHRQPTASVPWYFINTGQQEPPAIPGVDDLSPGSAHATSTLADLEYHPGFTRYWYAVDSGQTDGQGRCRVALGFDPVKVDRNTRIVTCCGVRKGQPVAAPRSLLAAALEVERSWVPGTVSVTPAQSFVVFAPTCLWTAGGTVPAQPVVYEMEIAQPDDPATGRHVVYQYLITLTPGRLHIDWGDGFSDDVAAAAVRSAPPINPPRDCTIQHLYKQVSGEAHGGPPQGLTVRVTQPVTVSATVTSFDGATTASETVVSAQQPPALDYTPDPQPRHRVEQIEAVLH